MLQREHSSILSTFVMLTFVIKIFVLSCFLVALYTGFTVMPVSYLASSAIIFLRERETKALIRLLTSYSPNLSYSILHSLTISHHYVRCHASFVNHLLLSYTQCSSSHALCKYIHTRVIFFMFVESDCISTYTEFTVP